MLFKAWVSYVEIYNEVVNDLLNPGSSNLKLQEDPTVRLLKGVYMFIDIVL